VTPATATAIIGFAYKPVAIPSAAAEPIAILSDSAQDQVALALSPDGSLYVFRPTVPSGFMNANTTYQAVLGDLSAAGIIQDDLWHYIEWKCEIGNSAAFSVRVNGVEVIAETGQDTQYTANAQFRSVGLVGCAGSTSNYYDDFYICDSSEGTGSHNDDFLGDCRVVAVLPATGNGTNTDWTPSTGVDHGAMVDEAPPNDDTDYISSSTVGHQDTFNYPSVGYTGTVYGVQLNINAKKTDAGLRTIAAVARPASTDFTHATEHAIGTGYQYWSSVWDGNPEDDGAWDASDVDGAEFGVEVTA
jgi:hypothetical protein